jgi:hypothetical protein
MGRFWTKGRRPSCEFNLFIVSLWLQFWFVRSLNDSPYEVRHQSTPCSDLSDTCHPPVLFVLQVMLCWLMHITAETTKQQYLGYWLWESSVEPGELTEQEAGTYVHPVPAFWTCHHCCLPPALSPTDWFPAAWHMMGMRGASQVRAVAVGMRWCWQQSVSIQRWLEQAHKWMVLKFRRNVEPSCTEVKHSKKNTRMSDLWNEGTVIH